MLRRAARPLLEVISARSALSEGQRALATKASTYIVGLDVDPDARNTLLGECRKILDAVQDIPAEAGFRKQTERLFGFYKHMCENQDIRENSELEQKIGKGQLEELISQARQHLNLIPKMKEWKPWETGPEPLEVAFWEVDKVPEAPQK